MLHPSVRRRFETLVATACADGILSEEEKVFLNRRALELNIPETLYRHAVERGLKGRLPLMAPPNRQLAMSMLEDMIEMVCADGILERAENRLLLRFSSHVGITPEALGKRIRQRMKENQRKPANIEKKRIPEAEEVIVIEDTPSRKAIVPPPPRPKPASRPAPAAKQPAPPATPKEASPVPVPGPVPEPVRRHATPETESALGGQISFSDIPKGPIELGSVIRDINEILPPVIRGLVRSVILFDGVEAAARYVQDHANVDDPVHARKIIDGMMQNDKTIQPASIKVRQGA